MKYKKIKKFIHLPGNIAHNTYFQRDFLGVFSLVESRNTTFLHYLFIYFCFRFLIIFPFLIYAPQSGGEETMGVNMLVKA